MVKVERSYPAPESLATESKKKNGSYNEKDVVKRLRIDFHDKCYICELKGLQDPIVEHLIPHNGGERLDLKYDWENLFLSCNHCNTVKNSPKYKEGIIDCCKTDPEDYLTFELIGKNVIVKSKNPEDKRATVTADLIDSVFNMTNTGIREAACDQRYKALCISMNVLYRELDKYKKSTSHHNTKTLEVLLRRESEFAAFKREYVRGKPEEYPDLQKYVS